MSSPCTSIRLSTVISTAESRGVYSIGFQNLAAQQFAPEYWISGTGYTLGDKLTWLASTVLDGTWEPIFLRCGIGGWLHGYCSLRAEGAAGSAGSGRCRSKAEIEAGTLVVFAGPIVDQDGTVRVAEGAVLSGCGYGPVDWFVKGVVGSPK